MDRTDLRSGCVQTAAITVRVKYDDDDYHLHTCTNEYRSLMHLIYDKVNPEGFGECLGMGKCGTCLIGILKTTQPLSFYERNGAATLQKLKYADENARLACQVMADENVNGLTVKILT